MIPEQINPSTQFALGLCPRQLRLQLQSLSRTLNREPLHAFQSEQFRASQTYQDLCALLALPAEGVLVAGEPNSRPPWYRVTEYLITAVEYEKMFNLAKHLLIEPRPPATFPTLEGITGEGVSYSIDIARRNCRFAACKLLLILETQGAFIARLNAAHTPSPEEIKSTSATIKRSAREFVDGGGDATHCGDPFTWTRWEGEKDLGRALAFAITTMHITIER